MKIIGSNKKDYFDYLIYQYGQDPKTVLNRAGIGKFKKDYDNQATGFHTGIAVDDKYRLHSSLLIKDSLYGNTYVSDFLILNGKSYPLVLASTYPHKYALADETNTINKSRFYHKQTNDVDLVKLSKLVGRHAFIFSSGHSYYHEGSCSVLGEFPNLEEIGLAKIIDPLTMYTETVNFISSHFTDTGEVATVMDNKSKIVSHGFDLKTSFRGK